MNNDILSLEVRLLVVKYGNRRVLEAFAHTRHSSIGELEQEIRRLEDSRTQKKRKAEKSIDELTAELDLRDAGAASLIKELAHKYEAKMFLPSLREVESFLRHHGVERKPKVRTQALPSVLKALAGLTEQQLRELMRECTEPSGKSIYYRLAHQIMGKAAEK